MQNTQQKLWSYIGRSNKVQVYENESPQRVVIWGVLPYSPQAPTGRPVTYHLSPDEWRYDPETKAYVPITEENVERLQYSSLDEKSRLYHQVLSVLKRLSGFPEDPTPHEIAKALQQTRLLYRVESPKAGTGKCYVTKIVHPGGWVPLRG